MGKDLVVKDNALINASYHLSLVEQRLILLAIVEARESGQEIEDNRLLKIHASTYIRHFNVEKHTAYDTLRTASKQLFDRYVTYRDKNPKNGRDRSFHCRWVDKIGYEIQSGLVYLRFTPDVVPLITKLEESFTQYELKQISGLTSAYAIRLYEVLIAWAGKGKTPLIELQALRGRLGIGDSEHTRVGNLKKIVLDTAINQINQHTDIQIAYQQHKEGRKIVGFSFTLKQKKAKRKLNPATTERFRAHLQKSGIVF